MKIEKKLFVLLVAISMVVVSCNQDTPADSSAHETDEIGGVTNPSMNVELIVEASGSMLGFFNSNKWTALRSHLWGIAAGLPGNSDSIFLARQSGMSIEALDKENFRKQMNAGQLASSANTDLPDMIQQCLNRIDERGLDAVVLVSDMIYSPKGNVDILLSQYSTDIQERFRKKKLCVALVGAMSQYYGKQPIESSPYYYMVMGKSDAVVALERFIVGELDTCLLGSSILGVQPKEPQWSVVGHQGVMKSDTQKGRFTHFSKEASIQLAVSLESLSTHIANNIDQYISVATEKGTKVRYTIKKEDDVAVIDMQVSGLQGKEEHIVVQIDCAEEDSFGWIDPVSGASGENDRERTYSIEQLVAGLQKGVQTQNSRCEIHLTITKDK